MDQRADRMRILIINTFIDCLEEMDFSDVTIGLLSKKAMINRSTFYRYFQDKYEIRDQVIDQLLENFVGTLEVDFLHADIEHDENYFDTLMNSLDEIFQQKRILEILWRQKLLGRNVFEEMIEHGAKKIEDEILLLDTISPSKKNTSDWYAKLLMNNMLVSIRWWFANCDRINAKQMTELMIQHMITGTIPTLKAR